MKHPADTAFLWEVCGKLFASHLWKDVRFAPNISMQEDVLAFWHVLRLVDKVVYVPAYNYHYFCREGSAVNSLKTRHILDSFSVDKILWQESADIGDAELREALEMRFFNSRVSCLLMLSGYKCYAHEMRRIYYIEIYCCILCMKSDHKA